MSPESGPELLGRDTECEALDRLLVESSAGRSRVAVLRGEAGVGKSALLDHLLSRVTGWRVTKAVGVESEMEFAYSGLHQLCLPLLDLLERLPVPQRDALATVFGRRAGTPPERFLVGLATLSLLAEAAEDQPLLCLVDDAQWLDEPSAQVLGFVGRRLLAERVAMVCAARAGSGDGVLAQLPELRLLGLGDGEARALLLANLHGPIDAAVREQIVAECHGNPLALLELPRTWTALELAGGYGLPRQQPVPTKIERSYARRLEALPPKTRRLAVAAAAEPLGDPALLQRAARVLGLDMAAAGPAVDAGLLTVGRRVEFTHPLVRSAAYGSASVDQRRRVHRALAEATDADTDPDRRAWHRAQAAAGPDEQVAAELERSAIRARARGGVAAMAAFLQRSVALTADPARRAERELASAQASFQAGAFDAALRQLAAADAGSLTEVQRAELALVRGRVAFASGQGGDAPGLLLTAARQLESADARLARETYLAAWGAAWVAAGQVGGADTLLEICRAILALPSPPGAASPLDLLLGGLAALTIDGHAAAAGTLRRAGTALHSIPVDDALRWGWMATPAYSAVWDIGGFSAMAVRQAQLARDAGALAQLPLHLTHLSTARVWAGDFAGAASLIAEIDDIAATTGNRFPPYARARLGALQGRTAETSTATGSAIAQAEAGGHGVAAWAYLAVAVLHNGSARYEEALVAARRAAAARFDPWHATWALPELVEAATRTADPELAYEALDRLTEATRASGTDFALGVELRCRALLSTGGEADELFREAIDRLGRAGLAPELARCHLLYGEGLRRERRRLEARAQLRTAHDMLTGIGIQGFAERARHELLATGEKLRRRIPGTRDELSPQEEQIARLARDGLSNPEIGAQLFISARTVEWHLRHVFDKLGISSRKELRTVLKDSRLLTGS